MLLSAQGWKFLGLDTCPLKPHPESNIVHQNNDVNDILGNVINEFFVNLGILTPQILIFTNLAMHVRPLSARVHTNRVDK